MPHFFDHDHLYWQAAGKNHATGEKTTLIQLFEERDKADFLRTMEAWLERWERTYSGLLKKRNLFQCDFLSLRKVLFSTNKIMQNGR